MRTSFFAEFARPANRLATSLRALSVRAFAGQINAYKLSPLLEFDLASRWAPQERSQWAGITRRSQLAFSR